VNVVQDPAAITEPPPDPNTKAIGELTLEVKALRDRPQPETKISVDARTTIEEGAVQVAPAAVTVDARTSLEAGAIKLEVPRARQGRQHQAGEADRKGRVNLLGGSLRSRGGGEQGDVARCSR
jgi:hypothetical protein